jgi:hypothetical protein
MEMPHRAPILSALFAERMANLALNLKGWIHKVEFLHLQALRIDAFPLHLRGRRTAPGFCFAF